MNSYGMIYTTKKNFNFRSPNVVNDRSACHVDSAGNVDDNYIWYIGDSYGWNSPESNFGSIDYAWYITSDGIANNSMSTITGSYGLSAAIR